MNSTLKIFLVIFLSYLYFVKEARADKFEASKRYIRCLSNPQLNGKSVFLAYFSKTHVGKIQQTINLSFMSSSYSSTDEHLLSVCLCRNAENNNGTYVFPPLYFNMPYLESHGDDIVALCIIGPEKDKFSAVGVYTDEELYDLLFLKYQESLSSSVTDPFVYSDSEDGEARDRKNGDCLDLNEYPTKNVMGQRTCLFTAVAIGESSSLYSGALMALPLPKFDKIDIFKYCYTTVGDTIPNNSSKDLCFSQHNLESSKVACCCPADSGACKVKETKEHHFYCFEGDIDGKYYQQPVIDYFSNSYKLSCGVEISADFVLDTTTGKLRPRPSMKYISSKSCREEISVESPIFCSDSEKDEVVKLLKFKMTKCCENKNLCNYDLVPPELRKENPSFSPENGNFEKPALFLLMNLTCETFYRLKKSKNDNIFFKKVNLYNGFNAKILQTRQYFNGYQYIIAKIIKADSENCSNLVIEDSDVEQYFPLYNCRNNACDGILLNEHPLKSFKCQQQNHQTYNERYDTWFCYIKIIPNYDNAINFGVEAGYLEIKNTSDCYFGNVFEEIFCCVNVFNLDQSYTKCTIEKMKENYLDHVNKTHLFDPSRPNDLPDFMKTFTQCVQRNIGIAQKCPGNDGCFETRSLEESDKSKITEPSGCLGLAEKYTVENLPLTSLSLGCRVGENSNRCSVTQMPDGQQKIVCCCTDKDNEQCRTKANKLPNKIGKHISSFRGTTN